MTSSDLIWCTNFPNIQPRLPFSLFLTLSLAINPTMKMDTSNIPQNNNAGPMTKCIGTTTKYMPTKIEDKFSCVTAMLQLHVQLAQRCCATPHFNIVSHVVDFSFPQVTFSNYLALTPSFLLSLAFSTVLLSHKR